MNKQSGAVSVATDWANALVAANSDFVLCLAEPEPGLHSALKTSLAGNPRNRQVNTLVSKFLIVSNISIDAMGPTAERGPTYQLGLSRRTGHAVKDINVLFVHLGSPFGKWDKATSTHNEAADLSKRISLFEQGRCDDTIVIGDLNMDPFEPALVNGEVLNAAMCRKIAATGKRTFRRTDDRVDVKYFYNPMWNLLGDRTATNQPGSFYHSGDRVDAVYWHCLDQVLVRPSLIPFIANSSPSIVTEIEGRSLLKPSGAVDTSISDHLPVVIDLEL